MSDSGTDRDDVEHLLRNILEDGPADSPPDADGMSAAMIRAKQAAQQESAPLPSWQAHEVTAVPGMPVREQEPPQRRERGVAGKLGILGLVVLLALAGLGIGYWFGTRDSDGTETAADASGDDVPAAPDAADGSNGDGGTDTDGEGGQAGSDQDSEYVASDIDPLTEFGFESESVDDQGRPLPILPAEPIPNTPDATTVPGYPTDPENVPDVGPYTVIKGGRFYLRGSFSSENLRQELITRNLVLIPQEALVIEYTLDPDDPWYFGDGLPVFLEDKLLFDVQSSEINPQFDGLFLIGANLMMVDPDSTITVIGHTDSQGDEQFNLELSQDRVDSVKTRFIELGAMPEQVITIAKGESEPLADNSTEEGRAANRRVEFIIGSRDSEG